eukprot:m.40497 g.40497  ORF g.40497 m.40497 type:complete len:206 (+) comp9667_c0_seq2:1025-1642(+)
MEEFEKVLNKHEVDIVLINGHSKGAAMVPMAAIDAKDLVEKVNKEKNRPKEPKLVLVSVASPRVGNQAFVDLAVSKSDKIFRLYNQNDPAPMVPIFGYRHLPGHINLSANTLHIATKPYRTCCWFPRFGDHKYISYMKSIRRHQTQDARHESDVLHAKFLNGMIQKFEIEETSDRFKAMEERRDVSCPQEALIPYRRIKKQITLI